MSQQNEDLIREIHKAASSGLEAIETILPKIQHPQLRREVECQGSQYKHLISRSEEMLQKFQALPEKSPPLQRAVMWGAIQMNTLADASSEHMAEIMINGSNMGIVEMTKQLNRFEEADAGAKRLAEEFIRGEQRHIEELKQYL